MCALPCPSALSATANLWLVYLEGSMFCWDAASCTERFATHDYWMSSKAKPWQTDFAQARARVRLRLCVCA